MSKWLIMQTEGLSGGVGGSVGVQKDRVVMCVVL